MYLLEHDAKELLAPHGIAIPQGRLIGIDETIVRGALPPGPYVVKGQIAAGGRGKAGLIRKASNAIEAASHASEIRGKSIKGQQVSAVRIEQQVAGAREAYVGFLLDAAGGGVRVIV